MMERDTRFDVIKGIAILLVIVGHVMQFTLPNFEDTLIFNFIWSLQIPLFMVVSGFFCISKKKKNIRNSILQKIRIYIIPFVSYFLINVFFNYESSFLISIKKLPYHLEISLWYLYVLAILAIIANIANRISVLCKYTFVLETGMFFLGVLLYSLLYFYGGIYFLGIKYVIYYSCFFYIGRVWRCLYDGTLRVLRLDKKIENFLFSLAFVIYICILIKINLYMTSDTILGALPRVLASLTGVYCIIYIIMNNVSKDDNSKIITFLSCKGQNSLKLYYLHSLFVTNLSMINVLPMSVEGLLNVVVYSSLIIFICDCLICVIRKSEILSFLIFGEKLKKESIRQRS